MSISQAVATLAVIAGLSESLGNPTTRSNPRCRLLCVDIGGCLHKNGELQIKLYVVVVTDRRCAYVHYVNKCN